MGRLLCTLALVVAAAAPPAHARPAGPREAPVGEPVTEAEKVNAAIQAWGKGDWARVRALLEPLLQSGARLSDPLLEETALRYLADATINDASLADLRTELATEYLTRLLDSAPDWRPPDIHSRPFIELYNRLREERSLSKINTCRAEAAACHADKDQLQARLDRLSRDHTALQKSYSEQEVEVREKVARNRAVALIPFGVGHFYNGRKGLGAAFVATEVAVGIAAFGLLLYRLSVCDRTMGFQNGSLKCTGDRDQILAARNAEQTMGIIFFSMLALDVVVAQLTFRTSITVKKSRVRRSELDKLDEPAPRGGRRAAPAPAPAPAPGPPRARHRTHDILRLTPVPALLPGGGGLGLDVRF